MEPRCTQLHQTGQESGSGKSTLYAVIRGIPVKSQVGACDSHVLRSLILLFDSAPNVAVFSEISDCLISSDFPFRPGLLCASLLRKRPKGAQQLNDTRRRSRRHQRVYPDGAKTDKLQDKTGQQNFIRG